MALFTTYGNPNLIGVYDNELMVSHFLPNNNGKIFGRDSLDNVHHSGGSPEDHPILSNVMKNTNGHVFLNGSFKFEWEWPEGDVTEQEIDDYRDLIANLPFASVYVVEKATNKVIITMANANFEIPDWSGHPMPWHPKAPFVKLTATSDESEFVCVSRLNGTFDTYTFEQRTIEPGETLTLTRPDCDTCYFMFSGHVLKDTQVLLSKKLYKVTSESLEITNNQSDRIRILRYYK
jgi:hypothetical protein